MKESEIESSIRTILSGVQYFNYKNNFYKIISPSSDDYALAHYIAKTKYKNRIFDSFLTEEESKRQLDIAGIWTSEDENKYDTSLSEIEKLKVSLYESRIHSNKCKSIKSRLKGIRKAVNESHTRKYYLFDKTIEYHYGFIVTNYAVAISLCDMNSEKLFNKSDVLDISLPIIDKAYTEFITFSFSNEQYREMVRSSNWSSFWNCGKENVCGEDFTKLSNHQRTMIAYSKMYDNARQSLECPEEDVFKDDDMFDGWMIKQAEDMKEKRRENANNSNTRHNERMSRAGEIFYVAPDQEEAQEIFDSNTIAGRAKIHSRRKSVKQNPEGISEDQLPDVRMELRKKFIEQVKGS